MQTPTPDKKLHVCVNKQTLTSSEASKWKEAISRCKGAVNMVGNENDAQANQYWYDCRSGLWGWVGGPIQGIIEPRLPFITKTCEGNWTTKWDIEKYKPTNVWVNGREVHPLDIDHFRRLRLPIFEVARGEPPGFWVIDENGEVTPEKDESVVVHDDSQDASVVTVQVESAKWVPYNALQSSPKSTKHRIKRKLIPGSTTAEGYYVYPFRVICGTTVESTECRFSQLLSFHEYIKKQYRSVKLPEFPSKKSTTAQTEEFTENRRKALEEYLDAVFQVRAIRDNLKALEMIHIKRTIQPIPRARLQRDSFDYPLLSLLEEERIAIAKLIVYSAKSWPDYLTPILVELLKTFHLPDSVSSNLILSKSSVACPYSLDSLEIQFKWEVVWNMISEAVRFGNVDARFHVSVQECAYQLGLPLEDLLVLEGKCAEYLQRKLTEVEHKDGSGRSSHRKRKILLGGMVGGGVLLVTGLIATPLFIPVFLSGTAFVAAALPATLGLSSAVMMGGSLLALAMGPTLPLVFGAAGAGLGTLKAKTLTEGISEYGFCSIPKKMTKEEIAEAEEGNEVMEENFTLDWETKELKMKDEVTSDGASPLPSYMDNLAVSTRTDSLPSYMQNITEQRAALSGSGEKIGPQSFSSPNTPQREESEDDEEEEGLENAGLRVYICIQGWLWKESELTTMWAPMRDADPSAEVYSLRWETTELKQLGRCLVKTVTSVAAVQAAKFWIVMMSTLAAAMLAALSMPLAVITVSGAIDNSWTVVHTRAKKVGKMLAETLADRVQGRRPVTLFGVSIGSQVVLSCLKRLLELQAEGHEVDGIIENVYVVGSACSSDPVPWTASKKLIAGRLVNGYCKTDWILGIVHRTAGMTHNPAGLGPINSPAVENIDLTEHISGHMSYKKHISHILSIMKVGRSLNISDWNTASTI